MSIEVDVETGGLLDGEHARREEGGCCFRMGDKGIPVEIHKR